MSVAKSMYVKWIHDGKVYTGSFCTAQGKPAFHAYRSDIHIRCRHHATSRWYWICTGNSGMYSYVFGYLKFTVFIHGQGYRYPYFYSCILGTRSHQYLVAYTVVGLTWLFIGLFIAITVSVYTDGSNFYESPVGVSPRIVSLVLVLMACCDSIGAGSAIVTEQHNMSANTFGFGQQCLSPSSHTHRCFSGPGQHHCEPNALVEISSSQGSRANHWSGWQKTKINRYDCVRNSTTSHTFRQSLTCLFIVILLYSPWLPFHWA